MSSSIVMKEAAPVLFSMQDTARVVTLNRPAKLNALNFEMCQSMFQILNEYSKSDATNLIIVKSSDKGRSLCAGGDVATVAVQNLNGNHKKAIEFFEAEYSLNLQMATYPKPIVTYMNGITMGGGVGLSVHTPFRIATENTKWAMPEMDIGFFPDVGTTFALPRLVTMANNHSQMALYLCLTGEVLNGEDAYMLGLASHYVNSENLQSLEVRLGELTPTKHITADPAKSSAIFFDMVNGTINEFSTNLPMDYKFKFTTDQLDVIESCFDITRHTSIEEILRSLDQYAKSEAGISFCTEIKNKLATKSMTSMQIALKVLKENSRDDINSALRRDLFTASNMCVNEEGVSEFSEATKHKLVDKQKTPYPWKHNSVISPNLLRAMVSPKLSTPVSLWENFSNITWDQYPYHSKYQLPSEQSIKQYLRRVSGHQDGATSAFITKNEVLKHFTRTNKLTKDKSDVALICNIICERKCNMDPVNGALIWND